MGCGIGSLLQNVFVSKKWDTADHIPELKNSVSEFKNTLKDVKQNAEKNLDSKMDMQQLNKCYKQLKKDCDALVKHTVKYHKNHYASEIESIKNIACFDMQSHTAVFNRVQGKALSDQDVMRLKNAETGVFVALKKCTVHKEKPEGVDAIDFQIFMDELAKKDTKPNRSEQPVRKGPDVLY